MNSNKPYVDAALALLGVDRLVLAIHDQSFPASSAEEMGRGSPYGEGGRRFAGFIKDLGFNALQLGPQGKTTLANPSPYDSTLFSKNELSISLLSLAQDAAWAKLLDVEDVTSLVEHAPSADAPRDRRSYEYAWQAQFQALRKVYENFVARTEPLKYIRLAYINWTSLHAVWLDRDSLFEALSIEYGTDDWRQWAVLDQSLFGGGAPTSPEQIDRVSSVRAKYASEIDFFQFCQFIAHQQHLEFREFAATLKLKLYADLQIGFSQRDMWALRHLLLSNYSLGAPPSRTNPDGQPWGYPVLDPDLYFQLDEEGNEVHGTALKWFVTRIDKILLDFDGVRVDHPHGLVCPWVYKSDEEDSLRAVQSGARLFESPNVEEHPQLARYALVREDQINPHVPRYADGWVRDLSEGQIQKYSVLIQTIKDCMAAKHFEPSDLICEVLSSCPFPLKSVLRAHGLGRFRVTQKAQPYSQRDVYRSDNAQPEDWIMVGTHDTKTIWSVVEQWSPEQRTAWAEYLANRLEPINESARSELETALSSNNLRLVEAMFADLFIGPARNVSIFFADLLGLDQTYNEPGVISDANWVLSVPNNYQQVYAERVQSGLALNLPKVVSLALHAKCGDNSEAVELIEKLNQSVPVV